jgi:hypothetical protein
MYPTLSLPRHYKTSQNASRRVTAADCDCRGVYHCVCITESLEDNAGVGVRARGRAGVGVRARVCARAGGRARAGTYVSPKWRTFPPKWRTQITQGIYSVDVTAVCVLVLVSINQT